MRRRFGLITFVWATACGAAQGPAAAADCRTVSQVEAYRFELCAGAAEGPAQRLRLLHDDAEVFVAEDHRIEVAPPLLESGRQRDPIPAGYDVTDRKSVV